MSFSFQFLYEPFPVESSLLDVLPEHLNAEIVAGTICSKQDAVDYLTWTYFFRRLLQNPAYYKLDHLEPALVNHYLTSLIQQSLSVLEKASCVELLDDGLVEPTSLGRIASYYYLSYQTMQLFRDRLQSSTTMEELLGLLSDAHEYSELPVRHNEDLLNGELAKLCRLPVNAYALDSSHTKTHLLLQAHFSRLNLPCADYVTDTKSVLDQAIRILQAMMDVAAEGGWLATTLRIQQLLQMVIQAVWYDDPSVLILPHFDPMILPALQAHPTTSKDAIHLPVLQQLFAEDPTKASDLFRKDLNSDQLKEMSEVLANFPAINLTLSVRWGANSAPLLCKPNVNVRDADWIDIPADQECLLDVTFSRLNLSESTAAAMGGARPKKSAAPQPSASSARTIKRSAYAPKFPKAKDEGWFLTLGSADQQELLAMKRVTLPRAKCSHQIAFVTPSHPCRLVLTFYLMSDCYVGLDQQLAIYLNIGPARNVSAEEDEAL